MRILILCKRRPQGRDLLDTPYGRYFHLPTQLAARGHEVTVALLSYAGLLSSTLTREGVRWTSDDLLPAGPGAYLRRVRCLARHIRPHWILGASDTYFGILAVRLARTVSAHKGIDAYDNFESYMPWALPLHALWRRAVRSANLVTAAGPQLAVRLGQGSDDGRVRVLPMAADPAFRPLDRRQCRCELKLPSDALLIGYGGSFDRRRGARLLLDALAMIRARRPDARLVVSGHPPRGVRNSDGIVWTGRLSDEQMPAFINALDVACVPARRNAFGNYSYPAKLYEAMACRIPVVASDTGPMRWILNEDERFLAPVGDVRALAERILSNSGLDRVNYGARCSWPDLAAQLEQLLETPGGTGARVPEAASPGSAQRT